MAWTTADELLFMATYGEKSDGTPIAKTKEEQEEEELAMLEEIARLFP